MDSDLFKECVAFWKEAGPSPHEVLIEQGVYDHFLEVLESSLYDISNNPISEFIYRGMSNVGPYEVGDIIEFKFPHSWSEDYEMASNFAEENGVILKLAPKEPIMGIFIGEDPASYQESEVILGALKIRVMDISQDDSNEMKVYGVEIAH